MKSKSIDTPSSSTVKNELDHNNSFDFIRLYKTAEETKASLQKYKINIDKDKRDGVNTSTPKRERSPNKRKKNKTTVELSLLNIECPLMEASGAGCNTPRNEVKVTSTPLGLGHKEKVKSIMKSVTAARAGDDAMDGSVQEPVSTSKPKKRNKSVSFLLEDNDELVIKKTKSDEIKPQPTLKTKITKKKKMKKDGQAEKENKVNSDNKVATEHVKDKKDKKHKERSDKKLLVEQTVDGTGETSSTQRESTPQEPIKKKRNKSKKLKKPDESESEPKTQTNQITEKKKAKKKKHEPKSQTDTEEEPASKSRKKEIKPELIAEDLENLSIGDNPHTLSSLLDEMTVTDKEKHKKLRKKASKSKKAKSREAPEPQSTEEVPKEKKWKRKRWNKDRKAKETPEGLSAAVVVDNLPISMLFSYKKTLAEHFAKYGLLRNVGYVTLFVYHRIRVPSYAIIKYFTWISRIAEVYPMEVSKPVFTTTVYFDAEDAATKVKLTIKDCPDLRPRVFIFLIYPFFILIFL